MEERSVTAQLSWKRALEDSSPVMVNGSEGHQSGSPNQEDQPKELKVEEPPAASRQQKNPDEKDQTREPEGEEEKGGESPKNREEEATKPDALDDLFASFASSDLYNSLSKTQEAIVRVKQL